MDYQDVLALLGVGSAHPGGFSATVELIRSLPLKSGSRVLEVGCGTGRTACYLAKTKRVHVTAVDIRELMIEKAKMRMVKEGVSVDFQVADASSLPFETDSFDVVYAESVTVFTEIQKALSEYCRVTKPGGQLYDREMCQVKPFAPNVRKRIEKIYGVKTVPTFDGWIQEVKSAGYRQAGLLEPSLVPASAGMEDIGLPDFYQDVSEQAFSSQVQKIVTDNATFMKTYHSYLGYTVVSATK